MRLAQPELVVRMEMMDSTDFKVRQERPVELEERERAGRRACQVLRERREQLAFKASQESPEQQVRPACLVLLGRLEMLDLMGQMVKLESLEQQVLQDRLVFRVWWEQQVRQEWWGLQELLGIPAQQVVPVVLEVREQRGTPDLQVFKELLEQLGPQAFRESTELTD